MLSQLADSRGVLKITSLDFDLLESFRRYSQAVKHAAEAVRLSNSVIQQFNRLRPSPRSREDASRALIELDHFLNEEKFRIRLCKNESLTLACLYQLVTQHYPFSRIVAGFWNSSKYPASSFIRYIRQYRDYLRPPNSSISLVAKRLRELDQ